MKPQRCIVSYSDHVAGVEQGDCWRACIASVVELPSSEVPNFVNLADDDFLDATRKWLAPRGWAIFARYYGSQDWPFGKLIDWLGKAGPGVAFIVTGRSDDMDHAVVVLDGNVHDPGGVGISGPHDCTAPGCDCDGYWWVYVLTPIHGDRS